MTRTTMSEVSTSEFPCVAAVTLSKTDDGDTKVEFHMVSDNCGGVPFYDVAKHLPAMVEQYAHELAAKGTVCVPVSRASEDGNDARPN
jgi:hypothetical protein